MYGGRIVYFWNMFEEKGAWVANCKTFCLYHQVEIGSTFTDELERRLLCVYI